jgi:hypothetical protein
MFSLSDVNLRSDNSQKKSYIVLNNDTEIEKPIPSITAFKKKHKPSITQKIRLKNISEGTLRKSSI